MYKSAKRTVLAAFTAFAAVAIFSTFTTSAQQPARDDEKAKAVLAERLGIDDGYALAIHYSGDLLGNLETCG